MCACDKSELRFSRRGFGAMFAGTGFLVASSRFAFAAGDVDALAVTCIDYRLVDDAVRFFDSHGLNGRYDQVSLAGAALAAVSPKFPSSNAAFWDQLAIAINLHHVKKLIVVDHRDCGAYKVAFGKDYASAPGPETLQHKEIMTDVQGMLAQKHPGLASEFYLMALDGRAEKLV